MAAEGKSMVVFALAPGEHIEPWEGVDISALLYAVVAVRNAWRAGRETFDVVTMSAFGDLIREAEAAIHFAEDDR